MTAMGVERDGDELVSIRIMNYVDMNYPLNICSLIFLRATIYSRAVCLIFVTNNSCVYLVHFLYSKI